MNIKDHTFLAQEQLIERWTSGYNQRNVDEIMAVYHENIQVEDIDLGLVWRGYAELKKVTEEWLNTFQDFHLVVKNLYLTDRAGTVHWAATAKLQESLPGFGKLPAETCGKSISIGGIEAVEFAEDGRIKQRYGAWNLAHLLQQAGLISIR